MFMFRTDLGLMEHFVIIVNGSKPSTIITKSSSLDVTADLDPPLMLLKMVILMKRKNLIKAAQSYEYIISLIFKDKMQVPFTLLLF